MARVIIPPELRAILAADPTAGERMARAWGSRPETVRSSQDAYGHFAPVLAGRETEALAVLALDRRHRPIGQAEILTTGNDAMCIVCPRLVLRWVLTRRAVAAAFVIAHNHPSGDPTPSQQDGEVTGRVGRAANVVGLAMLDHLVIGGSGFVSLAELGHVPRFGEGTTWTM